MDNEPLTFDEQTEVLIGVALAFSYVLSMDQREEAVRLLRTHADHSQTPRRTGILLRRLADMIKNPTGEPTQH
jgi:nitrogen-specific signal transduction histidine kinase